MASLVVVLQPLSRVQPFVNPWTAVYQASLSFTISQSLLKLKSIDSVMPSNHLILCCPLFLLPSMFPWLAWSSCNPRNSQESSPASQWKHKFFSAQPSLWSNSHIPYMTTGKTIALTIQTFVGQVKPLVLNMLSKLVITFFLRWKCPWIS